MTLPAQIPHTTSRIITRPERFERSTVGLEGRRSLHESALFRGRFEADDVPCGECAESTEPECPSEECSMCIGEVCNLCGAGSWGPVLNDCDHDVIQRHKGRDRGDPCGTRTRPQHHERRRFSRGLGWREAAATGETVDEMIPERERFTRTVY